MMLLKVECDVHFPEISVLPVSIVDKCPQIVLGILNSFLPYNNHVWMFSSESQYLSNSCLIL